MNRDKGSASNALSALKCLKSKRSKMIPWDTDELSAAKPQPKEITPSLPSPLEGEGLPCGVLKVTPQGKGGGDAFCLTKFKDFAKQ